MIFAKVKTAKSYVAVAIIVGFPQPPQLRVGQV
jgi:hypothetical protein